MSIPETFKNVEESSPMSRRDFLGLVAAWMAASSLGCALIGLMKFSMPALLPDIPKTFKIGRLEDYPIGSEKIFEERKVIVFRDQEGLYAMSLICTHLGCTVSKQVGQFDCPCHGSKFDAMGRVKAGPAPKPLSWLKISQLPDGRLDVNAMREVPMGTKFNIQNRVG